ncbi:MAG TPA: alpha/beta hydrolase [Candidatus Angelobacter sp.]|nr:alpha/beta hydrolase [Candidatus Angelobacter sp.]
MPNLATMLITLERLNAGLHRRLLQIGDHRVVYSEGGKGEPVVLVHGFGSSRDSWNRFAGRLTKQYRVIAPDMPGWGESTRIESESYGYPRQVQRLREFITTLGLGRVHLVGHSMGGFICSAYAAQYPDEVITLGLIAPHGVAEPQASELARSVAAGDNWLVASSLWEFDRLLDKVFCKRPYIPKSVLRQAANRAIAGSDKSAKIFWETQKNDPPLEARLAQIKAPALIIWGDQDRVLHVSCAEVFRQGIQNSEVLLLPGSGHMPLIENARQCATAWIKFVEKTRGTIRAAA